MASEVADRTVLQLLEPLVISSDFDGFQGVILPSFCPIRYLRTRLFHHIAYNETTSVTNRFVGENPEERTSDARRL